MPKIIFKLTHVALVALALLLSGCGGGGGGGGGSTAVGPITLAGTLVDTSGNGLSGYTVTDGAAAGSATTSTTGYFQITIPATTSGSQVIFDFTNMADQVVGVKSILITVAGGHTQQEGSISISTAGPPVNPGS